jgi:hypothetical protein
LCHLPAIRRSAVSGVFAADYSSFHRTYATKKILKEIVMNRTYTMLSRTESILVAAGASFFSVVTVGAVIALFATSTISAAPDMASHDRIVLEKVVITALKSV